MESLACVNDTRTNPLQNMGVDCGTQQVQATPKERLHTVEEFISKLEQTVLKKL